MTATQIATTKLGAANLEITRLGLGAWAIGGGGWEHGWGPQDDDESIAAIRYAPSQLALAWLLRHSPAMLPISGTSSLEHLEENVAAAGLDLSAEQESRLQELG